MKQVAMASLMLGLLMSAECITDGAERWSAKHVTTVEGFAVPESAAVDPATGTVYVSNIDAASADDYWADDGRGSISKLEFPDKNERFPARSKFAQHAANVTLHSPKGLGIDGASLWAADNRHLRQFALNGSRPATAVEIRGAQRLNDVAISGGAVYVSDTAAGIVHRVEANGQVRAIPAPPAVNGITFVGPRLLAVSWSEHDIYELDPAGEEAPKAWGLAKHFKNLDGIESLDDNDLIVSDFTGNAVWLVAAEGREPRRLIEIESPADIGLDRQRRRLFVPQFLSNRLAIYELLRDRP